MRRKPYSSTLVALLVVAAALVGVAQDKFGTALMPREVLFGGRERTNPQISPGELRVDLVAYDWKTTDTVLFQANQRDPKPFDVYRVDLKTGKIEMDTENPGDVQRWQA